MATGRSDYPNQINNVLVFPGIFRGALDARATGITEEMKMAAARAIASIVTDDELNEEYIPETNSNVVMGDNISLDDGLSGVEFDEDYDNFDDDFDDFE